MKPRIIGISTLRLGRSVGGDLHYVNGKFLNSWFVYSGETNGWLDHPVLIRSRLGCYADTLSVIVKDEL